MTYDLNNRYASVPRSMLTTQIYSPSWTRIPSGLLTVHQFGSSERFSARPHMECCDHQSFLHRSRRTPEGASIEPFRITRQHLVVELFCCLGLSGEFLKIKNVLPGLSDDPWAVVIILHILMAGDDNTWLERLHLIQC